ncbi:MAG: hypothetical protein HGA76_11770, partial [Candidatus Firestonebacteria bacterium]|nr:hypothetical protein [Candidatus Firestonebacteria bacterium]
MEQRFYLAQLSGVVIAMGCCVWAQAESPDQEALAQRFSEKAAQWPDALSSTTRVDQIKKPEGYYSYTWPDTPADQPSEDPLQVAVPGPSQALSFNPPDNMILMSAGPFTMGGGVIGT